MTAVAGYWTFDSPADPRRECERMLKAQQIYAPDAAASWSNGAIAMGRRLFKLLPEDRFDRGPVTDASGRRVLVADVRLDNRDELGRALGIEPAEAKLLSDSAMLMKALERWDEQALVHIVGDFAFALWDGQRQRLLLARDYAGQRPLHFHRGRGFLAFASMPKGLHALPDVVAAPNVRAAADFLALLPETGRDSFFEDVERVPPGHVVSVTGDGVSVQEYWRPPLGETRLRGDEEYIEALREQLDGAVSARLRGVNGDVAAHLSAGLDSSAVAATAARILAPADRRVAAFTSVPGAGHRSRDGHRIEDEGPLAAATARLYPNIDHIRIQACDRSPIDKLDRNFFLYERPVLNICNDVWLDAINDAARDRGIQVMLTGSMGNVSLSYSGLELLPTLLAKGRLMRLMRLAASMMRNGIGPRAVALRTIGPVIPLPIWTGLNRLSRRSNRLSDYTALNPSTAAAMEMNQRAAQRGYDLSYRPASDGVGARVAMLRHFDAGNYNKGTLAGWGIDLRDPTADRRLMEFCLSIPLEQYTKGGIPRSLARRALTDRLPPSVLRERRRGTQGADWHAGFSTAQEHLRDEVTRLDGCVPARDVLDLGAMRRSIEEWPSDGWTSDEVVQRYRLALLRGVSAGHFLRKAAGTNL